LHKREINKLKAQTAQKGLTVAPVKFYLKRGRIELEIALARGKKLYGRNEELKHRAESEIWNGSWQADKPFRAAGMLYF